MRVSWHNRAAHWAWSRWRLLRWSWLLVLVFLILLSIVIPNGGDLLVITMMWIVVAAFSFTFADLMRRRTSRFLKIAKAEIPHDDALYILTETNHTVVLKTEIVHFLFFFVGIGVFVFPEWLRAIVGRDAVMLSQYLLFLIIARTYLSSREISNKMSDDADKKQEVAKDKDVR